MNTARAINAAYVGGILLCTLVGTILFFVVPWRLGLEGFLAHIVGLPFMALPFMVVGFALWVLSRTTDLERSFMMANLDQGFTELKRCVLAVVEQARREGRAPNLRPYRRILTRLKRYGPDHPLADALARKLDELESVQPYSRWKDPAFWHGVDGSLAGLLTLACLALWAWVVHWFGERHGDYLETQLYVCRFCAAGWVGAATPVMAVISVMTGKYVSDRVLRRGLGNRYTLYVAYKAGKWGKYAEESWVWALVLILVGLPVSVLALLQCYRP